MQISQLSLDVTGVYFVNTRGCTFLSQVYATIRGNRQNVDLFYEALRTAWARRVDTAIRSPTSS